MCLHLKDESVEVRVAKKDIIVYKRLHCSTIRILEEVRDGDLFTGLILGTKCSGKISKLENSEIFFCTNTYRLDGDWCKKRHGYMYSWAIDGRVTSIIVDGVELVGKVVTKRTDFQTPYQKTSITIGETYESDLVKINSAIETGLHSFGKLKDAKNDGGDCYVKCIIPEGSQYYKGIFGKHVSYASDKLTCLEIVK